MSRPIPPGTTRAIGASTRWVIGLVTAAIALLVAGIVAIVNPSGDESDWTLGPGGSAPGGASGTPVFDVAALAGTLDELPEGLGITAIYVDYYGDGFIDACSPDDEPIAFDIWSWSTSPADSFGGCPPMLEVDEIDLDAVQIALDDADPPYDSWVAVTIGDLDGLVEPSDQGYIVIDTDYESLVYTLDGEFYGYVEDPYSGGALVDISPQSAQLAISEITEAGDLATASTICADYDLGEYMLIGQRAEDPATTEQWYFDGDAYAVTEWPTSGPEPLPISSLDLPTAIERTDSLRPQWQHNFPLSSVCADVAAGGSYEVTYYGYLAGIEHSVVTDPAGTILRQD